MPTTYFLVLAHPVVLDKGLLHDSHNSRLVVTVDLSYFVFKMAT